MICMKLHELILEKVIEFGEGTLDSFFPKKYPEARLWRSMLGLDRGYCFSRRSFSAQLSQLRAQGLVERMGARRNASWRITKQGRLRAAQNGNRRKIFQRLVIFDIPERERAKRTAIRVGLIAAGYYQLQKSVWAGRQPLPEDFTELLDALHLHDKVHILGVRHFGTLDPQL